MIPLRPYQSQTTTGVRAAWSTGARNVLAVLPTGGGKTVVFSDLISQDQLPAVAVAHRQELVGQMSIALARCGVVHRIIAPQKVIRRIVHAHVEEVGAAFYESNAPIAVAGVDTLLRQADKLAPWCATVRRWVIDEAHHVLVANKWGKAAELFPNAIGLGVTATPIRASGEGLGRHADGVFDTMVEGPTMRELIDDGWLTDYRIFAPQSDIDLSSVDVSSATGDYSKPQLTKAIRKSHIVGDVVEHYQRIAPGKLGVTFASDVETATDMAASFNAAGVPAEVVSAKTPDAVRALVLRRFRQREILMLVNVDLFGEGFDLPAIEVVIMARPTESFALFCQQFGRALRLMLEGPAPDTREGRVAAIAASSKPRAIVIDHVGNVLRHGLPDARRDWTLDARERRSRDAPDDVIPLRSCLNVECLQVFERFHPVCPYCGHKPIPAARSAPEFVDGDLLELDAETLAAMRGDVERVDMDPEDYRAELAANHCPPIGQAAHVKRHKTRQEIQRGLRAAMDWWAGHHRAQGRQDAEIYRRFYLVFGVDALSAQALNVEEAIQLADKITDQIAGF